ncbi:hypothetical protein [Myxococcus xanthus]|uniref:Uncharacterized protein n=1 Tax=Myxococcus xanthus TaxID=34 RepID=A0AAE6FVN0_MYXXA|nr:hypothetical protein [Myxococcus xanthus]QDE66146.1 hypothetical protein BHS09_03545 [Myxococcus xanthus]QDE73419.1 hypothetical protein BHS08_03550 [Myxococcus xanthus]QDE80688.1 hypothetical protein BHS07_03475 [Myxococcus xanthus]QDE95003.1 hypothetical protein BHS05_03515 [Myxococcus xanthus]
MFKVKQNHTFQNPMRQQIDQTTQGKKSDYAHAVGGVNQILDRANIGISSRSQASVIDNVKKVETGERSEVNAHQREALNFGRDAFENAKKGNYKQAGVEAFGSTVNGLASLFKSTYTETPSEKRGIAPH